MKNLERSKKLRVASLMTLLMMLVLSYQNCAPGFVADQVVASNLASAADDDDDGGAGGTGGGGGGSSIPTPTPSGGGGGGSTTPTPTPSGGGSGTTDPNYDGKAAGNLITTQKNIVTAGTAPTTMTWNLGTELESGAALAGASVSVQIARFEPADGSTPVYFVSNPTLTAGAQALDIVDLRVGVDGVRNDVSTTFQGLNAVVAARATSVLSPATLVHEIGAGNQHRLSLHFRKLWPNGVAVPTTPTPTPPPVLSGANLYAQHCLGCHGTLANSTKRGRTAQQIVNSFTTAPSMSYLAPLLTAQEIQAIADALK